MFSTLDRIITIANDISPRPAPATSSSTYDTLGFDSLACVEFAVAIEDTFQVEVSCADRLMFADLEAVAAFVDEQLAPIALAA